METILLFAGGAYLLLYALGRHAQDLNARDPTNGLVDEYTKLNGVTTATGAAARDDVTYTTINRTPEAKKAQRNVYSDMHAHQNVVPLRHA